MKLSEQARVILEEFYNRVELALTKGEAFEYMTGFPAKAPEMAVRIAGVQTLYADENSTEITGEMISNGIAMMDWYLGDAACDRYWPTKRGTLRGRRTKAMGFE